MRYRLLTLAAATLLVAGCQTVPPPDPVTMDEVVDLAAGGPESPALKEAIRTRPLGFPLTYESLKELEKRGVSAPVIDTIVALSVDRRARRLAPRYGYYDYDPWPWYGPSWRFGFGYHYHRHR